MEHIAGFDPVAGDHCRNLILTTMLSLPETTSLGSGDELRIINIIKTTFLDILHAFSSDLPAQYASQFQSHAHTLTENNSCLWDIDEFFGFLTVYKIELLTLFSMLDKGPDTGSLYTCSEHHDDLDPVRCKIAGYTGLIDTLYDFIQKNTVNNLNLNSLNSISQTLLENADIPVERLNESQSFGGTE